MSESSVFRSLMEAVEGERILSSKELDGLKRILDKRGLSEDAISKTLLASVKSCGKDKMKENPDGYGFGIADHKKKDEFNESCRYNSIFVPLEVGKNPQSSEKSYGEYLSDSKTRHSASAENDAALKQLLDIAVQLVDKSRKKKYKTGLLIMVDYYLHGTSYEEIAKVLHLKMGSCKVYVSETCDYLKEEFSKQGITFSDYADCF